ncbi:ASCH domain-containing protein [Microbacterium sp. NPDC055521]
MSTPEDLPVSEYAFPGPLRDLLVGAIIAGEKTTTTFLLRELEIDDEPMPAVGDRAAVIDSAGIPVGIETVEEVRVVRLADVELAHALGEGEGYVSVDEWRAGHESFWHGREYREYMGDPEFRVDDDTLAVLVRLSFQAD